jgi:hypothetical protein
MSDDKPADGDEPIVVTTDEVGKPLGPIRRGNSEEFPVKDRVSESSSIPTEPLRSE